MIPLKTEIYCKEMDIQLVISSGKLTMINKFQNSDYKLTSPHVCYGTDRQLDSLTPSIGKYFCFSDIFDFFSLKVKILGRDLIFKSKL